MTELKPCPFCGGEAVRMAFLDGSQWPQLVATRFVGCKNNGCFVASFMCSADKVAERWNTRWERTCRNLSNDGDVFVCSECQNETHGFMFDDFGCTVGFGLGVGRCPNCGAKVVR